MNNSLILLIALKRLFKTGMKESVWLLNGIDKVILNELHTLT